jgi:hypothetical protein
MSIHCNEFNVYCWYKDDEIYEIPEIEDKLHCIQAIKDENYLLYIDDDKLYVFLEFKGGLVSHKLLNIQTNPLKLIYLNHEVFIIYKHEIHSVQCNNTDVFKLKNANQYKILSYDYSYPMITVEKDGTKHEVYMENSI